MQTLIPQYPLKYHQIPLSLARFLSSVSLEIIEPQTPKVLTIYLANLTAFYLQAISTAPSRLAGQLPQTEGTALVLYQGQQRKWW